MIDNEQKYGTHKEKEKDIMKENKNSQEEKKESTSQVKKVFLPDINSYLEIKEVE